MKKLLLIGFAFLLSIGSFAQLRNNDISFEARYPIPQGQNFMHVYKGVLDLGVDYNIYKSGNWGLGASFNTSVLQFKQTFVTLYIISPKLKAEYAFDLQKIKIIPQVGVGVSDFHFRAAVITGSDLFGNEVDFEKQINNDFAITLKGATKIVINSNRKLQWYGAFSYELSSFFKPTKLDINFNRNMQLIYPGIGVIWKFDE